MNELAVLNQAEQMLAEIHTIEDAKRVVDTLELGRIWARKVGLGLQGQNRFAEYKIRGQRSGGEILLSCPKAVGARGKIQEHLTGGDLGSPPVDEPPTYAELGIEKGDARDWQVIASMPNEDFEAYIAETQAEEKELTTAGIVRAAKQELPHVAFNSGNNEWYTPADYIEAARAVMGTIDLDPASTEEANKVIRATKFYSIEENGLAHPWHGKVWMNPPYASGLIEKFSEKLATSYSQGDVPEAIALVNNATETGWFQSMAVVTTAICFPSSRVKFWAPDGKVGAPLQGQGILYFGSNGVQFHNEFNKFGLVLWRLSTTIIEV